MQHRSSLALITSPLVQPVTLDEAKLHLRVAGTSEDDLINAIIEASTAYFDGRDGVLNRCLVEQTWELRLDHFPYLSPMSAHYDYRVDRRIEIPLPPVRQIVSVKYVDPQGVLQTLSPDVYQLIEGGFGRAAITEAHEQNWPDTRLEADAVRIQFTAGYAAANGSPLTVDAGIPTPIVQAIKLRIGDLFEHREGVAMRDQFFVNPTVDALVHPYVVGGLGAA